MASATSRTTGFASCSSAESSISTHYDPRRNPVGGATILLTDPNRSLNYFSQSSADGSYSILDIQAGTYTLAVVAEGFQVVVQTNLTISKPTTLNKLVPASSATLVGQLVDSSNNPYAFGNVNVFDASGQWIGGKQTAIDGSFAITTASGSSVTIVASAQAGLPVRTTLASVQNGTNNVGNITVSQVAIAEEGTLPVPASLTSNQPADGPSPQNDVGDPKLQELQTLHDRFNQTLNNSINFAQKPLPPNPLPCDVGNITDQYNLDLYRRWLNSTGIVTTDANQLQPLLNRFQTDINAASEAGFQMQSATADALAKGWAVYLDVDLQLGVIVALSEFFPPLRPVAAFLAGFVIQWVTFANNQGRVTVDDAPGIISSIGDFIAIFNEKLGNRFSWSWQIAGIGLEFANWGLEKNIASMDEDAYNQALKKAYADLPVAQAAANQLQSDYNNMMDLQQQPYLGFSSSDCPQPDPPPLPCNNCDTNKVPVPGPSDPNAKMGPAGFGSLGWVAGNSLLPYSIEFENSTNATAPAQQVNVSDFLSTNLDWNTFELSGIGFGNRNIPIPPSSDYFETNFLMTYSGVTFDVKIDAGIDYATGEVFADFYFLDPITQLPPAVNIGFLPPEDGTGRGMGYVSYFVSQKPNLPTGTQITNIAYIQFDENPVIATDQANDEDPSQGVDTNKMAIVTIDSTPPVSSVSSLPAIETNTNFTVCWSGTDVGSGIVSYDIYVSANSGPWTSWLASATSTCATFNGQNSNSYAFYSVAHDGVGNVEPRHLAADATTTIQAIIITSPPSLTIALNGHKVVLAWPMNAGNYVLQTRTNLALQSSWSAVTNTPSVTGSSDSVTLPITNTGQFFRLQSR